MTNDTEHSLSNVPSGNFSITFEGQITFANAFCCAQLEYSLEEFQSLNVSSLLSISGRIFYQTHFFPLVKLHQHVEEIFLTLITKNKKEVPVVLNALVHSLHNRDEIIFSFIPVYNRRKYEDEILLARRKAEEALTKNEELEGIRHKLETQQIILDDQISQLKFQNGELLQLSSVISHDLQEPIRKLILYSNELLDGKSDDAKKERALKVINKASRRAKEILFSLQNYLGLTDLPLDQMKVDLSTLINNEIRLLQSKYPNIILSETVAPLPKINGSENQFCILFHHILENAFIHGTTDNRLELNVDAVIVKENLFHAIEGKYLYTDYVKITIADKGPGFEASYNEYVFNVLKRLNVTNERLGLGLAFCKRITENHKGKIKAEGQPGVGASFTITLPAGTD